MIETGYTTEVSIPYVPAQEGLPVISYPWYWILTQDEHGQLDIVRRWWS
jgi:hypothetical protein